MNSLRSNILLPRLLASLAIILIAASTATTKPSHMSRTRSAASLVPSGVTLNLADFGAVGDGVTNDGPAFQSALNALASAGGGTLLVPAGRYFVATPIAKDFSSLANGTITIQGVPSNRMPAPPNAGGYELSQGLNLTSEIISAAGPDHITLNLKNLKELTLEHLVFIGRPNQMTDAHTTVHLTTIDKATIRHCEFYGLSTFAQSPLYGSGNIVRAVNSNLSIELSVFLGCTASSGAYGAVVENLLWRKFSITNSIFLDYGIRPGFFSKTGLGAPLSWINIGNAIQPTPSSPRREFVVRETFLDEGGWIGITAYPYRWGTPSAPIDLVYISGIKMNVPNTATTGHVFYDIENLMIETAHYGWSTNAASALEINRTRNTILDKLTCIDHADHINVNAGSSRLAVINSIYENLHSEAPITTILNTPPEDDPVQYVRQQFLTTLGRQPDPAAHFYWSDLLVQCGENNNCLSQQRAELSDYLADEPQPNFSISGTAQDEHSNPLSGVVITLSGSQSVSTVTDAQGTFQFSGLPTSGSYTVAATREHYNFGSSQRFVLPPSDVTTAVVGRSSVEIAGSVLDEKGAPVTNASVTLSGSQAATAVTDGNGNFRFSSLLTNGSYTVTVSKNHYSFVPSSRSFVNPADDVTANFNATLNRHTISGRLTDANGAGINGVMVRLNESTSTISSTDGSYSFAALTAGQSYVVSPSSSDFDFAPLSTTIQDLSGDQTVNFTGTARSISISGSVVDENGSPLNGARVNLSGSQSNSALTDLQGTFQFGNLVVTGTYTVTITKQHYSFATDSYTFESPHQNVTVVFDGQFNRHTIDGRIMRANGTGVIAFAGVTVQLTGSTTSSATTDANGYYSFANLAAGGSYTVIPVSTEYAFAPFDKNFQDLGSDQTADFAAQLTPLILTVAESDLAVALDSTRFLPQPFSVLDPFGFGADGYTRIIIFAKNVEQSDISLVAEDGQGNVHPLNIEYIGVVPGQSWMKQLNVKLSPNLVSGTCVHLRLSAAGINSNRARVCIGTAP